MCLLNTPAQANQSEAVRAQQNAFAAMLSAPGDRTAMLDYARASVAARDYEAVVATLERFLDLEPGNRQARLELAVAYQALGSYDLAEYHLGILRADPHVTAEQARQIDRYSALTTEDLTGSTLWGSAAVGIASASDDGGTGEAARFDLNWRLDLGDANTTYVFTELRGAHFGFEDETFDASRLIFRTGPSFAVDGTAFGPRIRPYIEAVVIEDGDGEDYNTLSLGAQYSNTHSAEWSSFASLSFGQRNADTAGLDADVVQGLIGVTYRPSRDTLVRFSVRGTDVDADSAASDRQSLGARIDLVHEFDVDWGNSDRKWRASAFLSTDEYDYDTIGRDDTSVVLGGALKAYVHRDLFLEASGYHVNRDSSAAAADQDRTIFSLMIGMDF